MVTRLGFPVLWVGPHGTDDPALPPGSEIHREAEVSAWLVSDRSPELLSLWRRGMDAACSSTADRSTRRVVRAVRTVLSPKRPSTVAALAEALALPEWAEVLRTWPPAQPLTITAVAARLGGAPANEALRLWLALEDL